MASWKIKGAIHKVLAAIPMGHSINELLQIFVTKSLELTTSRFENKLNDFKRHWGHYHSFSTQQVPPTRALELGSGWYPMTPIGLYLCGVDEIWTCDIAPLLKPSRIRLAMNKVVEYSDEGKLAAYWPDVIPSRIETLRHVAENKKLTTRDALLEPLGIRVLVRDARDLPLDTASVDIVTSYGVLMHIPEPILRGVLKEFRRVLKPGGVTSHWSDLCDLYSWGDSSISPLNFLQYSDAQWQKLQDPITPSNRLRASDYPRIFADCGLEVTEEILRRGDPKMIDGFVIADEFKKYGRDDLLVLDSWIAARPADIVTKNSNLENAAVSR